MFHFDIEGPQKETSSCTKLMKKKKCICLGFSSTLIEMCSFFFKQKCVVWATKIEGTQSYHVVGSDNTNKKKCGSRQISLFGRKKGRASKTLTRTSSDISFFFHQKMMLHSQLLPSTFKLDSASFSVSGHIYSNSIQPNQISTFESFDRGILIHTAQKETKSFINKHKPEALIFSTLFKTRVH